MYIPRNWEFGSALAKIRIFFFFWVGGLNPKTPSVRHWPGQYILQALEVAARLVKHRYIGSAGKELDATKYAVFLDFKFSLCSVLTVLTFGCFPSVRFILADVSEPSVRSIFKGFVSEPSVISISLWRWTWQGSETSANINLTLGKHPKVNTVNLSSFYCLNMFRAPICPSSGVQLINNFRF
jgi:hypothetical protein